MATTVHLIQSGKKVKVIRFCSKQRVLGKGAKHREDQILVKRWISHIQLLVESWGTGHKWLVILMGCLIGRLKFRLRQGNILSI